MKKQMFFRIFLKVLRRIPHLNETLLKISAGPIKGFRWCVKFNDNSPILGDTLDGVQDLLVDFCRPGDIVYDLGANGGYVSMLAGKLVGPEGYVYAFEPLPSNQEFLRLHFCVNGMKNIRIEPICVGAEDTVVQFSNNDDAPMSNSYIETARSYSSASHISVDCRSLDSLAADPDFKIPDILKIDVEGAELDVLKGGAELIASKKPIIFLGTHDRHVEGIDQACRDFLENLGYELRRVEPDDREVLEGIEDYLAVHPESPRFD